ncbi:MAG: O-antigen ligase family protein [Acidimicrobiia bacterium]
MTTDNARYLVRTYGSVVVAALVIGLVVARLPWELTLLIVLAVVGVTGLAAVRIAVRPPRPTDTEDRLSEIEDPRFRAARLAYYIGAGSIGLLTIRPAMGFAVSDWIFLTSLGLAVTVVLMRRIAIPFLVPRAIVLGVVVFAIGGLISSLEAVSPNASAMVVIRMLYLTLVWFWLGTMVLQTRAHVHIALAAWVGSAALSSGGAVAQFFLGDVIPGGGLAWGRMTGFTTHWNQLGGLTATAFVPALMLAVDSPKKSMQLFGMGATALISAGLLLSGSVGGLLAASGATVLWLALRGMSLRLVIGVGAVVATGLILMTSTGTTESPSPVHRILRVTSAEEAQKGTGGTIFTRLEGWSDAWARIREQPIVGVGLDEASTIEVTEKAVHNMLLGPWFTAGFLGLVGILVMIGGSLAAGAYVLRNTPPGLRSETAAILAALVGFVQFGMGEPILYVRYGWFPTALLIALRAQRVRAGVPASESRRAPRRGSSPARRRAIPALD